VICLTQCQRFQAYCRTGKSAPFAGRIGVCRMPFGSEGVEDVIALALSGGGFRATLFHVGALWRLNELGILGKLGRISSISGGSITAGVLAEAWRRLAFTNGTATNFRALIVDPLRAFCQRDVDVPAIGEGVLVPWKRASANIEATYGSYLVQGTLRDLPDTPRFIFGATNLQTGRSFRFSKPYMGDYRIGLVNNPRLPLARVIAASSAFPPFLSPVVLDNPGHFERVEGADLNGKPEYTQRLYLADGGVYDNLGLETVWNRCRTVLTGDAGAPFSVDERVDLDWVRQTLRALDVATDQSRGLRKRALIDDYRRQERQGAYWGIDTSIDDYGVGDALKSSDDLVAGLASMRTRLNHFEDVEQEQLINWGYAVCDAAVRRYTPALIVSLSLPQWPYRDNALDRRP
jgi:NTE family protein